MTLPENNNLLELTTEIITAMLAGNNVTAEQLPSLISSVHASLASLGQQPQSDTEASKPEGAVSARKSLSDSNAIVSMIDGKSYSSLKRHIAKHGYTPESYREAYGLKRDYPMVAPGYSERRRELAKTLGLGRKPAATAASTGEQALPKKARKAQTLKAEAVTSE